MISRMVAQNPGQAQKVAGPGVVEKDVSAFSVWSKETSIGDAIIDELEFRRCIGEAPSSFWSP
jgi:hypothetical protein